MNDQDAAYAEVLLRKYLEDRGVPVKKVQVKSVLTARIEYDGGVYMGGSELSETPEAFARSVFQGYADPLNRVPWPGDGRS